MCTDCVSIWVSAVTLGIIKPQLQCSYSYCTYTVHVTWMGLGQCKYVRYVYAPVWGTVYLGGGGGGVCILWHAPLGTCYVKLNTPFSKVSTLINLFCGLIISIPQKTTTLLNQYTQHEASTLLFTAYLVDVEIMAAIWYDTAIVTHDLHERESKCLLRLVLSCV